MKRAWWIGLVAFVVATFCSRASLAHGTGVSKAEYTIDDRVIRAAIVFRREELAIAYGEHPERGVADSITIVVEGAKCTAAAPSLSDDAPDGSRVSFELTCATSPSRLHITSGYLDRFPVGHTSFITVTRGFQKSEAIALLAQPDVDVDVSAEKRPFSAIVRVGVAHILTGYDHLTFLFALLLVPQAADKKQKQLVWALLGVLTAFTIGHTLSLAIAAIGGVAPSPRVIEPAIALSIAYVAAENFFVKGWRHRWLLTFPFGLVHGFGFAGGLLDLAVDRADLPRALFAFNLGVELGQLGVLAIALPAVLALQRLASYGLIRRALSGVIVALGLVWFILRVVAGP